MSWKLISISLFLLNSLLIFSQPIINVNNIEIIRDEWGIPHIFTETDAEAVYGIGWAQCEDNFNMMQENLAMAKGIYGLVKGFNGATIDYIVKLFEIEEFVKNRYKEDIDKHTESLLSAYVLAINNYAVSHQEEVTLKELFPLDNIDILQGYIFSNLLTTHSLIDVAKVLGNKMDLFATSGNMFGAGSNAMAYNHNITADGKVYLVGNPHQPVDGPANFWEVSVHSKEGYEFWGATLSSGGVTPGIGTNRNLGWTHTTNFEDYSDVYHLEMHPHKKNYYKFDGEWVALEVKKAKLKVKFGPFCIPFYKKYYTSKYGPTLKNKDGYFSVRSNCFFNIRFVEQSYKMGLAKNIDEFIDALNIQSFPGQTITYADKEQNIFHLGNGILPKRDESYEWRKIVPGNSSRTLWSYEDKYDIEKLPFVKNPRCGYVFNSNNSAMDCTAMDENPQIEDYPKSYGILTTNTLRAKRFKQLIKGKKLLNFDEIKAIRDDVFIDKSDMNFRSFINADDIPIVLKKYKELAKVEEVYNKWNGELKPENKHASIFSVANMYFSEYLLGNYAQYDNTISEQKIYNVFYKAQKFLMKNYNSLEVELGKVQKISRGNVELPMYGSATTLANSYYSPYKKGKIKCNKGDTYIFYAQYGKEGLEELKAINVFGNSNKPSSDHYTDQLEMFVKMELRTVILDNNVIEQQVNSYNPK